MAATIWLSPRWLPRYHHDQSLEKVPERKGTACISKSSPPVEKKSRAITGKREAPSSYFNDLTERGPRHHTAEMLDFAAPTEGLHSCIVLTYHLIVIIVSENNQRHARHGSLSLLYLGGHPVKWLASPTQMNRSEIFLWVSDKPVSAWFRLYYTRIHHVLHDCLRRCYRVTAGKLSFMGPSFSNIFS
jgi:hypothetical protein